MKFNLKYLALKTLITLSLVIPTINAKPKITTIDNYYGMSDASTAVVVNNQIT